MLAPKPQELGMRNYNGSLLFRNNLKDGILKIITAACFEMTNGELNTGI